MGYNVIMTLRAKDHLRKIVRYLIVDLGNEQAARSLKQAIQQTIQFLEYGADTLRFLSDPELQKYGYKRITIGKTRYFFVYRIEANTVWIDAMFHEQQDYPKLFWDETY